MIAPGTILTDTKRRWKAKVRVDGSLDCEGQIAGSIHKMGAAVQGAPSCNGWSFWHYEAEDGLIQTLIDAARARVEGEVGLTLASTSAAPLRLAVMMLVLRAYERGESEMSAAPVEGWIAPYRVVRL